MKQKLFHSSSSKLLVTITCLLSSKSRLLFASASGTSVISSPSSPRELSTQSSPTPPFITGRVFTNGIIQEVSSDDKMILAAGLGEMALADVFGCCSSKSSSSDACSSSSDDAKNMKRIIIGQMPQFTPIIPIAPYDSLAEVITYAKDGKYGQQVSIFTSTSDHSHHSEESKIVADLIDRFSTVFGKININSQCGRSPDTAPFSGRRSSAMGVMSVSHALSEFSIPTLVSYKDDAGMTRNVIEGVEVHSNFLTTL